MAGLPGSIIDRAQYLINQMEKKGVASKILDGPRMRNIPMDEVMQLSLFEFGPEKTSKLGRNDVQNN
jgi:hypothetical protein